MFTNSDSNFDYQKRQQEIRIKIYKAFSDDKLTQTHSMIFNDFYMKSKLQN